MDVVETIILVGSVVASVGAVVGAIAKLINPIKNEIKSIGELKESVINIEKHENENYMSLLRLTIMSNEIPLSERVSAGEKYVEAGGNGDVKAHYKALQKKLEREYAKNEETKH